MKRLSGVRKQLVLWSLFAALLVGMAPGVWAASSVGVVAEIDKDTLPAGKEEQTVAISLRTEQPVNIGGFQFTVVLPEGFSVQDIQSTDPNVERLLYTIPSDGSTWNGLVMWFPADVSDKPVSQLATMRVRVPADAAPGTYRIGAKDIRCTGNYGRSWPVYLSEAITAALTITDPAVEEAPGNAGGTEDQNSTPADKPKPSAPEEKPSTPEAPGGTDDQKPAPTDTPSAPEEKPSTPGETDTQQGSQPEGMTYVDVAPAQWFYKAVQYVTEHVLMNGVAADRFAPDGTLTRGMMVTVLWRMEGAPQEKGAIDFSDVESGTWYEDAVNWASAHGVVKGFGDGTFGPSDPITREQMAVMLHAFDALRYGSAAKAAELSGFRDRAAISVWAEDAVRWAVAEEIIHGRSADTLDPKGTATRAEVATILMNYLSEKEPVQ